jgi:hypothetical protein
LQSTCIECHDFHQQEQILMEVSHMGSQSNE